MRWSAARWLRTLCARSNRTGARVRSGKRNAGRRANENWGDIPIPAEIDAILEKVTGRWRPLFWSRSGADAGIRDPRAPMERRRFAVGASIRPPRADRFNKIGPPKSDAGERTIPLPAPYWRRCASGNWFVRPVSLILCSRPAPERRKPRQYRKSRPDSGIACGRRHGQRQSEIFPDSTPSGIFRLMVHQSEDRRRPGIAAQNRPRAAGAFEASHDGRSLRPSISSVDDSAALAAAEGPFG